MFIKIEAVLLKHAIIRKKQLCALVFIIGIVYSLRFVVDMFNLASQYYVKKMHSYKNKILYVNY